VKKLILPLAAAFAVSSAAALASGDPESSPSASASASASPSASSSASAPPPPPPPISQVVPATPSDAPTTEWETTKPAWSKSFGAELYRCEARLVREWLKVECEPTNGLAPVTFGAVWGIAGDLSGATAKVPPLGKTMPGFKPASTEPWELEIWKKTVAAGGRAEVVLPLRPGSAMLVELGRMGWAREYSGDFEMVLPGPLLEVSWAKGEPQPRVVLDGVVVIQ
jgi:hypothetical protein